MGISNLKKLTITHIKMSETIVDSGMGTTTENSGAPGWTELLDSKPRAIKKTKKKSKKSLVLDGADELDLKLDKKKKKKVKDSSKTNKNNLKSIVTEKQFQVVCEPCTLSYD